MSHELVMIFNDDDGEEIAEPVWHLVDPTSKGGPATKCTSEYFGYGESGCIYKTKVVQRGGITCESCLEDLKLLKNIKL